MVNIPPGPFKVIEVDETDPFISNALRRREAEELCWCGSGQEFGRCHLIRGRQPPLPLRKILHEQNKIFWRKRGCMHPNAGAVDCKGGMVDGHTIQRKGPLSAVIDERNHVCRFESAESDEMVVKDLGWKKASTFPGFCAFHDSESFSELERVQFSGTHEQCVLQAYRCLSNELYKKRALIETVRYQRGVVDRGFSFDKQVNFQLSCHRNLQSQKKSFDELRAWWQRLGEAVISRNHECLESKVLFFQGVVPVVSAAALHAEFDFKGRRLVDMWDLRNDAEMLVHSLMLIDGGGAIAFVWERDSADAGAIVDSFLEILPEDRGDAFVQYCFLNCENTYFSRAWWNNLPTENQQLLKMYAPLTFYEGGAFKACRNRLVNWKFT